MWVSMTLRPELVLGATSSMGLAYPRTAVPEMARRAAREERAEGEESLCDARASWRLNSVEAIVRRRRRSQRCR